MTSTCWTLWQRMPTRYQLTVRTPDNIDEGLVAEGESFRTPRSPRQTSRDTVPVATSPRTDESPREKQERNRTHSPQSPYFPNRKSGYIDHYKTQQRVNSARLKLVSDPSSFLATPKSRAKTAPSIPLSNPSMGSRPTSTKTSITTTSRTMPNVRMSDKQSQKTQKGDEDKSISNNCVFNFDDANKETDRLNTTTSEREYKKYIVKELEDGTMYIDNGKIIFYKKHRQNASHYLRTFPSKIDNGGFLASIRHEYLKKPKQIALQNGRARILDQRFLERQRIDYNRKAGHILDYYSVDDEDRISMDDLAKFTKFQPTDAWRGCGMRSQPRSQKSARVRKVRLTASMPDIEGSEQSSSEFSDDANEYLKLNTQSKLHERNNFYLRTPGFRVLPFGGPNYTEIENCKCGMCRLEMLMAHFGATMRQLPEIYNGEQLIGNGQHPENTQHTNMNKVPLVSNVSVDGNDQHMINKEKLHLSESPENKMIEDKSSKKVLEQKLTITVPGMNIDREMSDVTTAESVLASSRIDDRDTTVENKQKKQMELKE